MEELDSARVACTLTSTLLKRIRANLGEAGVRRVVNSSGVSHSTAHLEQVDNWIPYSDAVLLFEAAVEISADEQIGWRVGQDAVRQHAGTAVATLLRSLGRPSGSTSRSHSRPRNSARSPTWPPRRSRPGRR